MFVIFTFQLIQTISILWFCHRSALPHASTGTSEHVPSNGMNIAPSPECRSPSHAPTVPPATPTEVHNALFLTRAPPGMGPSQAPSPTVIPRLAPSPRMGPSQAPSPRVSPSQAPSPRMSPSQAPPAVPTTPYHLRHQQPSPRDNGIPTHRASPYTQGTTGTNIFDEF
jgi:hypothetical protein